jgi:hypothetical protein
VPPIPSVVSQSPINESRETATADEGTRIAICRKRSTEDGGADDDGRVLGLEGDTNSFCLPPWFLSFGFVGVESEPGVAPGTADTRRRLIEGERETGLTVGNSTGANGSARCFAFGGTLSSVAGVVGVARVAS